MRFLASKNFKKMIPVYLERLSVVYANLQPKKACTDFFIKYHIWEFSDHSSNRNIFFLNFSNSSKFGSVCHKLDVLKIDSNDFDN